MAGIAGRAQGSALVRWQHAQQLHENQAALALWPLAAMPDAKAGCQGEGICREGERVATARLCGSTVHRRCWQQWQRASTCCRCVHKQAGTILNSRYCYHQAGSERQGIVEGSGDGVGCTSDEVRHACVQWGDR